MPDLTISNILYWGLCIFVFYVGIDICKTQEAEFFLGFMPCNPTGIIAVIIGILTLALGTTMLVESVFFSVVILCLQFLVDGTNKLYSAHKYSDTSKTIIYFAGTVEVLAAGGYLVTQSIPAFLKFTP